MKHIKKFKDHVNEGLLFTSFAAIAAFDIIYNIIKKKKVFKDISKGGFEKLSNLTKNFKDQKMLVGDIIDNDDYTQIVYRYGGDDNMVTIQLYKSDKKLKFKWLFKMPIFPFINYSSDDEIEVSLTDDDVDSIQSIIDDLKKEEFLD